MSNDWLAQSACTLGRGIGRKKIDPVALTQTYLAAIQAHPLQHRIYARLTEDRALAEAEAAAARARADQRRGLLDGVPISWKDLFDTAGVATEAGSALLKDRVPETDATVLQNATHAGLVCLGKTHMSELAFSGLGLNPVTQTPPCINNKKAVSGGSSSGAATSVAFGLAACGIGSDTGGSVRIPAAWNDLVGLKTTSGLLSLQGVVSLVTSFDTVGPLCRTVEDAAHVLAALGGGKAPDLTRSSLKGRRFLICETVAMEDLEDAPRAAFTYAVQRLEDEGAVVDRAAIPEVELALSLSACLFTTEAYATWQTEIEANPDLMFSEILERFRAGGTFSGVQFIQDWKTLKNLRQSYLRKTASYDAVLVPASPILPPDAKRLIKDHAYYVKANLLALRNTRIGNLMGLTSVTLPTGVPSCGLMLLAAPFSEARLLRLSAAVERAI